MRCVIDRTKFGVKVDYDRSLERQIKAGRFDFVDGQVGACCGRRGPRGRHRIVIQSMRFRGGPPTLETVRREMRRRGLRPARLEELLSLAARRPRFRSPAVFVALGTECRLERGGKAAPALFGLTKRYLMVIKLKNLRRTWSARDAFACVREDATADASATDYER